MTQTAHTRHRHSATRAKFRRILAAQFDTLILCVECRFLYPWAEDVCPLCGSLTLPF